MSDELGPAHGLAKRGADGAAVVGPSTVLGVWRLVRELGVGGMGTVWRAERADGAFRMNAAVKLINRDAARPDLIQRFVRERQILANLEHAGICRLIDGGTASDGRPFLVMELVDGVPLDRYFEHADASIPQIVHLFAKLCDALSYAHARDVVHRDLKPSNIMVTARGEPKVLDFGIARLLGSSEPALTQTGEMALTPCYASPEQWRALEVGPASDVFSLGVMLYEQLAGTLPRMPGLHGVHQGALQDANVDEALQSLVLRAVQTEAELRFPTMAAFGEALRRSLDDGGSASSSDVRLRVRREGPDDAEPISCSTASDGPRLALELPGGVVGSDSPHYVVRPELEDACLRGIDKPGALIRIKGPRQMGKTSLMTRLLERVGRAGARAVNIDLRLTDNVILADLDRFLRWLCAVITRRLGMKTSVIDEEWDDVFGAKDNCTDYIGRYILPGPQPLVLAIDNVDRVFEHPATGEEFLALLRAWNEMSRSQQPWRGLRIVLAYATEMYLPMNINHSPFNVGLPVTLSEWDAGMVQELMGRHGLSLGEPEIARLMEVIGGHPHLIRVAAYHLAMGMTLDDVVTSAAADDGPFADHLKSLIWRLRAQPELGEAAARVMTATMAVQLSTELAFKLASLGLVQVKGNGVEPTRELYRRYLMERLQPTRRGGVANG
ncbi:AAA-like domain-containing protein [Paraliomyxa miuraensis]|uniref:AAA-like domain-containing protein n=1 Tax=Paraliomyxa miuraensis TaxID=376150 RepID=UPI00225BCB05|nr:AAA-like domain-containing protein [Paraliomyxa miuraensis]MCX4243970.1 AAA-like domain-containing protein [Paraliomyxa miuraensis]